MARPHTSYCKLDTVPVKGRSTTLLPRGGTDRAVGVPFVSQRANADQWYETNGLAPVCPCQRSARMYHDSLICIKRAQ